MQDPFGGVTTSDLAAQVELRSARSAACRAEYGRARGGAPQKLPREPKKLPHETGAFSQEKRRAQFQWS